MKFLIDTNIFIPLEPGSKLGIEAKSESAAELLRIAGELGVRVFVHPLQMADLERDKEANRKLLRQLAFQKYPRIPEPPCPSEKLESIFSNPAPNSNDWVDCRLAASLEGDVVTHLITDDKGLIRRAGRAGLSTGCLTLEQGLQLLRDQRIVVPPTRPAIRPLLAHGLNRQDPIFNSLRQDYSGFDSWLKKCATEHRQSWVVEIGYTGAYSGVAIVSEQSPLDFSVAAPCLKICTFKISLDSTGFKLGELLLRSILEYAYENDFRSLFIETYAKQVSLIHLLGQFGFQQAGTKQADSDELVYTKRFLPEESDLTLLDPLALNKKFGPFIIKWDVTRAFIVPIEPRFHDALFPELSQTTEFWESETAYGNAMRKAYLCNSATGLLTAGDLLLFYRSRDLRSVRALGIVEQTLRSSDSDEISRFLGQRTVYPSAQIVEKCGHREALGILFRQVPLKFVAIPISELIAHDCVKSPPQSITQISNTSIQWIKTKIL